MNEDIHFRRARLENVIHFCDRLIIADHGLDRWNAARHSRIQRAISADGEATPGSHGPAMLLEKSIEVEGMVHAIGVEQVERRIWVIQVHEIAWLDPWIVRHRIEIDVPRAFANPRSRSTCASMP